MRNLLKVDFTRVLKDKLFMITCIIAGAFALFVPLLNLAIFYGLSGGDMGEVNEMLDLMGMAINAKSFFFSSLSLANNLGLFLPILVGIMIFKDHSRGTVRNKIVGGYKRSSIFISNLIVCFVVMFGIILAHALVTLFFSLIFFPFQSTPFTGADFGNFMLGILFEVLIYAFVAVFVVYLCATKKSMGGVIVLYLAISMGLSLVGSIMSVGEAFLQIYEGTETAVKLLHVFQRINIFGYSSMIVGEGYTVTEILCYTLSPILLGTGLCLLGILRFKRKDLK
ncbi:MAG: ABC transporter permease subunit [Clostridia bacterium]|nr:ABC transporter permease subunit [Clostridia bacterium]